MKNGAVERVIYHTMNQLYFGAGIRNALLVDLASISCVPKAADEDVA